MHRPNSRFRWLCLLLPATLLWLAAGAVAQDEDENDELPEFVPGLVARYTGDDGKPIGRLDEVIAFNWRDRSPDLRIAPGSFRADWSGYVWIRTPGAYRFRAFAAGKVKVSLGESVLIDQSSDTPTWMVSEPVELPFDYHPLRVAYEKTSDEAQLALFWSGPKFSVEPVSHRWLFHKPDEAPDDRFHQGQSLARALRCAACHEISGQRTRLAAPALDRLSGNLSRRSLADWLHPDERGAEDRQPPATRHSPTFSISRAGALAIAAYLTSGDPQTAKNPKTTAGNAEHGSHLFHTLGCLACHTSDGLGTSGLFGGGDLTNVAEKRPASFFARWLADPASINTDHRMPVFKLTDQERSDLAAYLASKKSAAHNNAAPPAADAQTIARGRELVGTHRCAACHTLPADATAWAAPIAGRLSAASNWKESCLGSPNLDANRPGYLLVEEQRQQIEQYVKSVPSGGAAGEAPLDGRLVMDEHNCLACHKRGSSAGIEANLPKILAAYADLAPVAPLLAPPALDSIGDKLQDDALVEAIRSAGERRPWLKIRMPEFRLSDQEQAAMVRHLVDTDRIPELPAEPRPPVRARWMDRNGRRLVTTEGFGCTSCHQIGDRVPENVAPGANGPDLSMLAGRIRKPWFDRWVRDPSRIVPRMEMPAVQLPVRGMDFNTVDEQLEAVWHILNRPGFTPPLAGALRVVRRRNAIESGERAGERAVVLIDNAERETWSFVKPIIVGLPNRHNVMFDLKRYRLAQWWIGDTARQRTHGKYWHFEIGGPALIPAQYGRSELTLVRGGKEQTPRIDDAFPPEVDYWEQTPDGVRWQVRLQFAGLGAGDAPDQLTVTQTFTAIRESEGRGSTGFRRHLAFSGVPRGAGLRLRTVPEVQAPPDDAPTLTNSADEGNYHVRVVTRGVRFADAEEKVLALTAGPDGKAAVELEYLTDVPTIRLRAEPPMAHTASPQALDIVPGFEAVRLPLTEAIMPTGLAWRRDGRLLFTSLKGRVWEATDTDGDEVEDHLRLLADGFSHPYGIAVYVLPDGSEALDIADKTALLRLTDRDGDGLPDRTDTVGSGWGHSTDYHGWAAGLPRDKAGNYYLAISQRGRMRGKRLLGELAPADMLRGRGVKLVPREPTADDPRLYRLEVLSAGFRFPLGIGLNRDGDLFISDNQGEYSPYSEINHVVPGAHFGFIAVQDPDELNATPKTGPVVGIPNPWVRSVNGFCFLDTPEALRERLGRDLYGPFEGHMVACDYDPRKMVRVSLHRVGDTYEGAVYPFSYRPGPNDDAMIGPIVCQVAPDGDIYVGSIRDSAWGAGRNVGELIRLRIGDKLPPGIAEIRATDRGFTVDFTQAVDPRRAGDATSYAIESFRRVATPSYGGDDVDRRREKIAAVEVSSDHRRVTLTLGELRRGHVYEFQLKNLTADASEFFPAEAFYSLGPIPQ